MFKMYVHAEFKLILFQKASEDNQKRVQELMRAFEEAQKLLKESNDACEEIEKHCQNVENQYKEQLEEKQNQISALKEELRKAKDVSSCKLPFYNFYFLTLSGSKMHIHYLP